MGVHAFALTKAPGRGTYITKEIPKKNQRSLRLVRHTLPKEANQKLETMICGVRVINQVINNGVHTIYGIFRTFQIKGSEHNSSELFLFEAAEIPDHKQAKGFHLL